MKIRFWGVRGSLPVPGPSTAGVGGNTTCVEAITTRDYRIILDAGTGIRNLGRYIQDNTPPDVGVRGTILFSHLHWDHIQGFPFFSPAFDKKNQFTMMGRDPADPTLTLRDAVLNQARDPYLPFEFAKYSIYGADLLFKEISAEDMIFMPNDVLVQSGMLDHPGGSLGFRITDGDTRLTYCTDTTHRGDTLNETVLALAQDTHLLIHDSQYTPEQKAKFPHYGHSSFIDSARAAKAANADALALTHHDPDTDDDTLRTYVEQARAVFPRTFLAREGLELTLPLTEIPEF